MEEQEKVSDLISRLRNIINQMAGYDEKILRSLHPRFDYIVCAIEESKDIFTLSLEELYGSLEARELQMDERSGVKYGDQVLASQIHKKEDQKKKWKKNKFKKPDDKFESSSKGGSTSGKSKGRSNSFDKKKAQCYNCEKFGHFVDECWSRKGKQKKDEDVACVAQEDSDSDTILLMATTNEEHSSSQFWFLDIGCSNHITSHKE
ncbi:uncharacterized protein [Cicer arietinum]|uniref:uncharacterized protein n=1 Tax=Cicer arietinum TaxID=3827 RepID=UPI003CC60448